MRERLNDDLEQRLSTLFLFFLSPQKVDTLKIRFDDPRIRIKISWCERVSIFSNGILYFFLLSFFASTPSISCSTN